MCDPHNCIWKKRNKIQSQIHKWKELNIKASHHDNRWPNLKEDIQLWDFQFKTADYNIICAL